MFHGWIPTVIQALGEFVLHCAAWVNNFFFWLVAKPLSLFPPVSLSLSLLGGFHGRMKCQIITHQGSNDLTTLSAARVDNYHVRRAAGLQVTCLDKLHDEAWTLAVTEKSAKPNSTNSHCSTPRQPSPPAAINTLESGELSHTWNT